MSQIDTHPKRNRGYSNWRFTSCPIMLDLGTFRIFEASVVPCRKYACSLLDLERQINRIFTFVNVNDTRAILLGFFLAAFMLPLYKMNEIFNGTIGLLLV